jgi:hypothetical protein
VFDVVVAGNRMNKLGNYEYPTLKTFKDALGLAQETLEKYAGVIPMIKVAEKLGYTVKDSAAISGTIYQRINDICMYGLLTREGIRGGLKATPLAKEALDPFSKDKAAIAKAKALRSIGLIDRAYSAWNGGIPEITALPARLNEITGADWTECKNQAASVKDLLDEAFPYIQLSKEGGGGEISPPILPPADRRDNITKTETQPPSNTPTPPRQVVSTEEYVLGDGIRIYLPKENLKASWERVKKAMKVLIEEEANEEAS